MTVASKTRSDTVAPRERLLASANELFYRDGVHSVGIDRIIEHAGVAKATLYNTYGSKDELVVAYLRARHSATIDLITSTIATHHTPRRRLLSVFEAQGQLFTDDFNGCAFVNATAEIHDAAADRAAADYRAWIRTLFTDLAATAGVANPGLVAAQLQMLYDAAGLSARMDRDGTAAATARAAAEVLLDAALAAS